jgi:hypothetical protein
MAEFDIAIVGTNLLSGLLAGVLARDHGKKVARIGRPMSQQRLPRSLNLALPLATRPETWRMLRQAERATGALLGSVGVEDSVITTEMQVVADLPQTAAAVDHLAHMALGHGHQVGRTAGGWAFRRVATLDLEAIERRLPEWLKAAGVVSIDDGSVDADTIVLADDDAIFDRIAEPDRPAPLRSETMTSTLIVSRPPPTPVRRFVDRGVTLVARPGNTALAIISGEHDVDARLASALPGPFPVKRLATTRYRRFTTSDGAPLIGNVGTHFVVVGFGDVASFFVGAIARLLAGMPEGDENLWFAAHAPTADRATIAEYVSEAAT